jgi:hypothetical protein
MTDTPQILLAHHLKALKLPTFLRSAIRSPGCAQLKASTICVT